MLYRKIFKANIILLGTFANFLASLFFNCTKILLILLQVTILKNLYVKSLNETFSKILHLKSFLIYCVCVGVCACICTVQYSIHIFPQAIVQLYIWDIHMRIYGIDIWYGTLHTCMLDGSCIELGQ